MDRIPIGYKAIEEIIGYRGIPHYRESYVVLRGRGKTIIDGDHELHLYLKTYALKNEKDLLENLEFGLKHEGINLALIEALFKTIEKKRVIEHIKKQPTGIYSRKIWYLYEFLMNESLPIKDCQRLKHVNLVNSKDYFTAPALVSPRHAINDNLLGNNKFCPIVRRTGKIEAYINLNLDNRVRKILEKYDSRLITRASNYLYTRETKSSYEIERDKPDQNRISRFVDLLQNASSITNLSKEKLVELQNVIVDPRYKDSDYRQNQNYVGENLIGYQQKIHYISPRPQDVPDLMQGLLNSLDRMSLANLNPVIIAAVISFGFVFIHPFEDGNGRIHRFLIHYILARKGFTPMDLVFPVSFVILKNMRNYDGILESFSKPLLRALTDYNLDENGVLTVNQESKSYYQYLDYTRMVEYLFECIEEVVNHQIESELEFLVSYDKTKKAMQEIVDMPDQKLDLFIKSVLENNGILSAKKRNRYPELTAEEIDGLAQVVNAMMHKPK